MSEYKTILIIDDDEIFAQSLCRSFLKREYEARSINSIKDLAKTLKNFHPRFAVIDLKLNQESGLDAIKQIKEFDDSIKIVMLTGYASITTTIEAIKSGAHYYLAKPANADDIIAAFGNEQKKFLPSKKTSLKSLEWEYINAALLESDFNISKAAQILGLHRRTLARKLEKRNLK